MKIKTKQRKQNMKFVGKEIDLIKKILLIQVGPDGMYLYNTQYGNEDDDDEEEMDDDDNDEEEDDDDEDNYNNHNFHL
jgi:hypothetical protein